MYVGIDIGGSHISGAVFDSNFNLVQGSYQVLEAPHSLHKLQLLSQWDNCITHFIQNYDVQSLGIAIPGEFNYSQGIGLYQGDKFTQLYGFHLKNYWLERFPHFHKNNIKFINDADAYAMGEYWNGALKNTSYGLILTLGTGLGACFVKDGKILKGENGTPQDGELYNKKTGLGKIADDIFSTRGILEISTQLGFTYPSVLSISQQSKSGDTDAHQVFQNWGRELGTFLSPYLKKSGVRKIVLGGNIANALSEFLPSLQEGLNLPDVTIIQAQLKSLAPLYGATHLFPVSKSS